MYMLMEVPTVVSYGDNIRRLRKSKGWTQVELAEKVHHSPQVISNWEREYTSLTQDDILSLSRVFNVSSSQIVGVSENETVVKNQLDKSKSLIEGILAQFQKEDIIPPSVLTEFVEIPIYGEIKAGYDFIAEQNVLGYDIVARKDVEDGRYFCLIVKGDSMIDAGIKEGSKVLVKVQDFVEDGKIGVVIVNGDEATLKYVYYDKDTIILQAANKNIPPKIVHISEALIQGQVKSYTVEC